jgi:hypothetical protein
LEKQIDEVKLERQKILDVMSKSRTFLKKRSIVCHHDAIINYIDHLIQEESQQLGLAESSASDLDQLRAYRGRSDEENRILTQRIETDINNENLDEVVLNQLTQSIAELEPEIRHY